MSSTPIALASWIVTQARPSCTAMYSGSKSFAGVLPAVTIRGPLSSGACSKPAVRTRAEQGPRLRSRTLTVPSGSVSPSALGSPSLATSSVRSSPVNVSMSGSAPAVTPQRWSPPTVKNCTEPGFVFGAASTATATRPFFVTATLLGPPPKGARSTLVISVGAVGSAKS